MECNHLDGARVGLALTGSFCTFSKLFEVLPELVAAGAHVTPILSYAVASMDTRFFSAKQVRDTIEGLCGCRALTSIPEVEPIGPKKLLDLLIVAPCTGNTCAKLACGIADTPVTMACKSHLRNERPILLGISTNDGLAANARNIGQLMARKHLFFIPFGQDDCIAKPESLVFDAKQLVKAANEAIIGQQRQGLLFLNA